MTSPNKLKHQQSSNNTPHHMNNLNHFDNVANGSLASTSTIAKSENGGAKIELPPPKNFNHNLEQTVTSNTNGVLANHTNKSENHTKHAPLLHPKIDEKLEKMRWFHGLLTRDNAEKVLVKDGDYLVRETNKAERQYVLSGRYKGECRHIFLVDPSGVVR